MKHEDIIIKEDKPFENCRLGREAYANILSEIVDSYRTGFVLAINGVWGIGKTTFVKMWMQQLKNQGHRTIYFNAWENDFVSEPMVGILGEFRTLISSEFQERFDIILKKAAKFSNKVIPTLIKSLVKKHIGEDFVEIIEKGAEAATDLFEDEIKNYEKKKHNLQTLKDELKSLVKEESGDKPLIFIVDELDRCRPDYAVEVLEKIKHFFSVEGIVFVLSIDKKQLGNSIRGYYGSEKIDADEYLRRFIDIEYSIPVPSIKNFCEYLYDYFAFGDFFDSWERKQYTSHDRELFLRTAILLSTDGHLSLRQIEKLFAHTRIALKTFEQNNVFSPDLLLLLVYIKYYNNELYEIIEKQELSIQELVDELCSNFTISLKCGDEYRQQNFVYILADLIYCYNNCNKYKGDYRRLLEISKDKDGNDIETLVFNTDSINEQLLINAIRYCNNNFGRYDIDITNLTNRIDLLERLKY